MTILDIILKFIIGYDFVAGCVRVVRCLCDCMIVLWILK